MKKFLTYATLAALAAVALSPLAFSCPPQTYTYQQAFAPQFAPQMSYADCGQVQGDVVPFEAPQTFAYAAPPARAIIQQAAPQFSYGYAQAAPAVFAAPSYATAFASVQAFPVFRQRAVFQAAPAFYGRSAFAARAFAPVAVRAKVFAAPAFVPGSFNAQVIRRGLFGRVRTVVNVQGFR